MKINAQMLMAFAEGLLSIAESFNPKAAGSVKEIIDAGTDLNNMVRDIQQQTAENAPEVWKEVRDDFAASLDAFKASVAASHAALDGS